MSKIPDRDKIKHLDPGDKVNHPKYGIGEVIANNGYRTTVKFKNIHHISHYHKWQEIERYNYHQGYCPEPEIYKLVLFSKVNRK